MALCEYLDAEGICILFAWPGEKGEECEGVMDTDGLLVCRNNPRTQDYFYGMRKRK
jgi:hypothetical protein